MTTYRNERGQFRKRTAEDAQREYEALSPFERNMHDAMAHAGRLQTRAILDAYADRKFFEGVQFKARSDEQGDLRALHMNRTNPPPQQTVTLASGHGLTMGDVITFSAPRPKWWRRALIWLRIIKPKPLRKFVVTGCTTNTIAAIDLK